MSDVSLASVTNGGLAINSNSSQGSASSDLSTVAFMSDGTSIDTGVAGGSNQIYVRTAGSTVLASRNATKESSSPRVAAAGDYVVFATKDALGSVSSATSTIATFQVSSSTVDVITDASPYTGSGVQNSSPDISSDGSLVVFVSTTSDGTCSAPTNIIAKSGSTFTCLTQGTAVRGVNTSNSEPRVSADGTTVAFTSRTSSSVRSQIYEVSVSSPTSPTRISEFSGNAADKDASEPSISSDGTSIAFTSSATNLATNSPTTGKRMVYLYRSGGSPAITLVSKTISNVACDGDAYSPAISPDGNYVAFLSTCQDLPADMLTSSKVSVFVYDRTQDKVTSRASVSTLGNVISGNATAPLAVSNTGKVLFGASAPGIAGSPSVVSGRANVYLFDPSCSSNSDSTGGADCVDVCPYDAAKNSSAGICGCGVSDVDTDNDGTPDCEDACPNDAVKAVSAGQCGCGSSDADADGNGIADCFDPRSSTRPGEARVRTDPIRRAATVTFPGNFADESVTYEMQFFRGNKLVKTASTTSRSVRVRGLPRARLTMHYRVKTTLVTSRWSKLVRFDERIR